KGHVCLFLPKFHCELNPIEMLWGYAKYHHTCTGYQNVTDGRFSTAKTLVPQCLDMCDVLTIHHFFHKAWHYMDAYRKGLDAQQAAFAVKKYHSHHRVGLATEILATLDAKTASRGLL
ncbi:hypothetical protein BDR04DRAFT_1015678, partial [Suillus decipiens]